MVKTAPWCEGSDAEKVRASIAAYENGGRVERTASASTPTVAPSVPAEGNPWPNAFTGQPLEAEDDR